MFVVICYCDASAMKKWGQDRGFLPKAPANLSTLFLGLDALISRRMEAVALVVGSGGAIPCYRNSLRWQRAIRSDPLCL
eukprot:4943745-Amphidinium_carterae.2